jgi:ribosomal protein L44E
MLSSTLSTILVAAPSAAAAAWWCRHLEATKGVAYKYLNCPQPRPRLTVSISAMTVDVFHGVWRRTPSQHVCSLQERDEKTLTAYARVELCVVMLKSFTQRRGPLRRSQRVKQNSQERVLPTGTKKTCNPVLLTKACKLCGHAKSASDMEWCHTSGPRFCFLRCSSKSLGVSLSTPADTLWFVTATFSMPTRQRVSLRGKCITSCGKKLVSLSLLRTILQLLEVMPVAVRWQLGSIST